MAQLARVKSLLYDPEDLSAIPSFSKTNNMVPERWLHQKIVKYALGITYDLQNTCLKVAKSQ